jgi:membrane protein
LISFGLILVIGFLLLVSLTITTALTVFGEWVASHFSPQWAFILVFLNFGLSLLTITTLFTLIFKILPDAKVQWPVAFLGGALSAVLFTIGQYLITFYFEWVEPQSSFGAAGSIILLMIWVFYSCMILTIGAEFSRTYAMQANSGCKAPPENIAKRKARKD